jgi:hypothetical protein
MFRTNFARYMILRGLARQVRDEREWQRCARLNARTTGRNRDESRRGRAGLQERICSLEENDSAHNVDLEVSAE